MKPESIIVGIAGALFGLLCGWMLGAQQAGSGSAATPVAQAAPAAAGGAPAQGNTAPVLDLARVQSLEKQAADQPNDADVRTQLGNLYFDSEKYGEAVKWYQASLKLAPRNPDVSTDLAVSYYYSNQVDQALAQFQNSLDIDPKHTKTWLNLGIVRAFGKQDLTGAGQAWEKVMELAPADSPEARAAKQALDGLKSAHPETGGAPAAGGGAATTPAPKQGA